jgi:protein involved in polysaccharide export with SLBB domain
MTRLLYVLLALLALAAPAHSQAASSTNDGHALRPGDVVRVAVWRRDDLSGEFAVAPDGTILHPILKRVTVAGVPLTEAERRLSELLRTFEGEADFVLEPLMRVVVGGEVRQPNLFFLPANVTIAEAVGRAGGVTENGRMNRVQLIRGGERTIHDLSTAGGDGRDMTIRSGDQIFVPRRTYFIRDIVVPVSTVTAAVATLVALLSR